jgi:hypothetical protein
MPFGLSITFALAILIAIALVIGLAAAFGSPVIAAPIVLAGIIAFLIVRGTKRARRAGPAADLPSTGEAAANPAHDSGTRAAQSASSGRHPASTR